MQKAKILAHARFLTWETTKTKTRFSVKVHQISNSPVFNNILYSILEIITGTNKNDQDHVNYDHVDDPEQ